MSRSAARVEALATAATALAGELDLEEVLQQIVASAAEATGCRYAALGIIGSDNSITQFIPYGAGPEVLEAIGHYPRGEGLLGLLIRDPRIIRLDDLASHPASVGFPDAHPEMHNFLGAPVRSGGQVYGNLYLTEKDGGFDEEDEALIEVLAAQAGAAIENALLSERLRSVAVQDERDRISRDLHDGVIQSLFSLGMSLESARGLVHAEPDRVEARLDSAVDAIDGAIRELRNYIFRLRPQEAASMGLSRGLAELAREYEVNALVRPALHLPRDLDTRVPAHLVADLLQIAREVLSNTAKHAHASVVDISLQAGNGEIELDVRDDGVGFRPDEQGVGRGLDNILERAAALDGRVRIASEPGVGTRITVVVPVGAPDAGGEGSDLVASKEES